MRPASWLSCGLLPALDVAALQLASRRTYAFHSSGSRPSSVLRDDLGIEAVFGKHHEAAQHLEEAVRDAVKEQLGELLGRPKGRPIDLGSLQRLPAAELAQACRQARLSISPAEHPHHLAAALHAWLTAPEVVATGGPTPAGSSPLWDRPASLRQSLWARNSGFGAAVTVAAGSPTAAASHDAGRLVTGPALAASAAQVTGGGQGDAGVVEGVAAANVAPAAGVEVEEAAEAALRAAAEREAEALFDEELQRRLSHAAATAATAVPPPAQPPLTEADQAGGAAAAAGTPMAAAAGPLLSAPEARSGRQGGAAPLVPEPQLLQPPPPQHHHDYHQRDQHQQHYPPHQQDQRSALAAGWGGPLVLSTTELLASAASGSGSNIPYGLSYGGPGVSGAGTGEASLFDSPPPFTGPPEPSEVEAAVRRSLSRAGYSWRNKDPRQLRSLLLLSRAELMKLLESFQAGGSVVATAGQSREQLAVQLAGLMNSAAEPDTATAATATATATTATATATAATTTTTTTTGAADAAAGTFIAFGGGVGSGAASSPQQPLGGGEGVWEEEEERDTHGDPRRRQVLAAARRRQQLLTAAAAPEKIATWLVKARAQDVVLISSEPDDDVEPEPDPDCSVGAGSRRAAVASVGSESGTSSSSYMVLATALSQRHAYACAEAVRYQIRERLQELAAAAAAAGQETAQPGLDVGRLFDASVLGGPSVSGFNGADWLSLEAGRVQVHVLTPQARRYYRLEEFAIGAGANTAVGATAAGVRAAAGADGGIKGGRIRPGAAAAAAALGALWPPAVGSLRPPRPPRALSLGPGAAGGGGGGRPRPRVRLFGPWVAGPEGGGRLPDTLETARVEPTPPAAVAES